jgi:hypothetical protein
VSGVDPQREFEAEDREDPRKRLKRLQARAKALEKEEAYWAVAEAVENLFKAAEELLKTVGKEVGGGVAVDIAVNLILDGVASLLDGIG